MNNSAFNINQIRDYWLTVSLEIIIIIIMIFALPNFTTKIFSIELNLC